MNPHPDIQLMIGRQRVRESIAAAQRRRTAAPDHPRRDVRLTLTRLLRRTGAGPAPATPPRATTPSRWRQAAEDVCIRRARPDDARALRELAVLADAAPLEGELLVAQVGGELWAACSLSDGRTIGDPFRPTGALRSLLELRRAHLAPAGADGAIVDGTRLRRPHFGTRG